MNKPVQLTLWLEEPETVPTQCPRCGHRYNAYPQYKRYTSLFERVMGHPKILELTCGQRDFLCGLPDSFLGGDARLGITEMSAWGGLSVPGTQHHVRNLAKQGILLPELKRTGGKYHVYRFAFPNGNKIP